MQNTDPSQPIDPRLLRLAAVDNVAVAAATIEAGQSVTIGGRPVVIADRVPIGHKLALVPIGPGELVLKYGAPIGSATAHIEPGQYVHTHNLKSDYLPTYTLQGNKPG